MRAQVSVVYFIAAGHPPEAVKIGCTHDVRSRLRGIQTGNHLPMLLLGTLPGDRRLERELHRRFEHLRLQGEWFRWSDEIAAVISDTSFAATVADMPFSGFNADDEFVGLLGRGYPRSFYRAFVRDRFDQWWRFQITVDVSNYDPVKYQRSLGPRAAQTFHGKLKDAAGFDGHPDNPALLRVLARARELAA